MEEIKSTNVIVEPIVNAPVIEKEVVVVAPVVEVNPKTKEDWQKLSETDPKRWMELTQQNTDRLFRESRELREQLERERKEKENFAQELNRYKQPVIERPEGQKYDLNNLPKNDAEWDTLFLESPKYATDLRVAAVQRANQVQIDFQRAFKTSALEVQGEHPDMYVLEVDKVSGEPLKDSQGKLVLKRDQNGTPILDENSQKGKIWVKVWNEAGGAFGNIANGPTLMMAEMERQLVKMGKDRISAPEAPKQNHVIGQGVPPPKNSTVVRFSSEEERIRAEKMVAAGVYKNFQEFVEYRDKGGQAIYDTNRKPDFTRK